MNMKSITDCRNKLIELRGRLRSIKFKEMVAIAEAVGRTQRSGSSPPIYTSPLIGRRSVSIHVHPGTMKLGTAKKTLEVLEGDIDAWECLLGESENKGPGDE